jgi:hypothetical protein
LGISTDFKVYMENQKSQNSQQEEETWKTGTTQPQNLL